MTTSITTAEFADPAPAQRLERAAAALTAHGFTVEILDDAAARTRIIPSAQAESVARPRSGRRLRSHAALERPAAVQTAIEEAIARSL